MDPHPSVESLQRSFAILTPSCLCENLDSFIEIWMVQIKLHHEDKMNYSHGTDKTRKAVRFLLIQVKQMCSFKLHINFKFE